MQRHALTILPLVAIGLIAAVAVAQEPTLADPAGTTLVAPVEASVETPAETTVEAPVIEPMVVAEPAPMAIAGPICCPIEVIAERTTLSARRVLRCEGPPLKRSVCVKNPAECCGRLYEVPLCVPCCCVGEPRVCNERTGLLGRGYVDLVWDCGYVARVVFRKHGGVIITYLGA